MAFHVELPSTANSTSTGNDGASWYNPCTLSFVFRGRPAPGGSRSHRSGTYIATAGHCLFTTQTEPEEVHDPASGPVVHLTVIGRDGAIPGSRIGRVVYAAQSDPTLAPAPGLPAYMDFGLIELDRGVVVDPAVCHFGGPTALRVEPLSSSEQVHVYGAGNLTGFNRETGASLVPARTGVGSSALHDDVVTGTYALSQNDSGGPIIDSSGRAVASVTGPHYQSRIVVGLTRAEQVLGMRFTLETAPLAADVPPFGADARCIPASSD
ncbi:MAG TPA: hypothetical protein VM345_10280 [Acidimicrobiales bacterium]|nr:hypothetical protein [Acidimicrobiales bacterium]